MKMSYYQARNLKRAFYFSGYLMLAVSNLSLVLPIFFIHCGVSLSIQSEALLTIARFMASLLAKSQEETQEEGEENHE